MFSDGTPQLAWAWALAALPLPLLVRLLLPPARPRGGGGLRVPFFAALSGATPGSGRAARGPLLLATLAWALLVLAAARPQWLGAPLPVPQAGRDLLLAVDISGSMVEEDMVIGTRTVDRLTAVQAVAGDFIERRVGDRIGLILFGSEAYLQAPLTFDRSTVRTLLFEAQIGLAGRDTAIGDALGLAVKRLRDEPNPERVVILLTDGANTAGNISPAKAAELAAAAGVRVHTIGFGAPSGGPFGLPIGRNEIDEETLAMLAEQTGGRFFRARDIDELLGIYAELDRLEPVQGDVASLRPVAELFAWPLGAALLLSALIAWRRWRAASR